MKRSVIQTDQQPVRIWHEYQYIHDTTIADHH